MIRVEELHKSFGSVHAVAGISFEVARGEVVGLLGPNGAGKTTTMRVLTGYLPADRGVATIDGVPVDAHATATKRLVGYLPENAPLYHDLEVVEMLRYVARLRGIACKEITPRIKEMVEVCGLGEVVGRPIGQLSKGYRQRVGLAAAMIHRPPVLVLDEPTSGLDPNQIAEIRALIRAIGRERTVVLSTHILQEVEATCGRALIINAGRLVGHGTLAELAGRAKGDAIYAAVIRAPRFAVEARLSQLEGITMTSLEDEGERVRIAFNGGGSEDRSEDIFTWVVNNGWKLAELTRANASLEEIFRELTTQDTR